MMMMINKSHVRYHIKKHRMSNVLQAANEKGAFKGTRLSPTADFLKETVNIDH